MEVFHNFELVPVRDHIPCLDLGEEFEDGDAVVADVLLVDRLDVLVRYNGDDDLPPDLVEDPLIEVVRPFLFLLLLQFQQVASFCRFQDRRVNKVRCVEWVAV